MITTNQTSKTSSLTCSLQHTLQHTATHCNTLQHTATHTQAGAKEYLDDYYELDFEDVIGDMPTRFKYKQGEAVDFGITPEQVTCS